MKTIKKVKAFPITQAHWGCDHKETLYFPTKEARDLYYSTHNYCDKKHWCKVEEESLTLDDPKEINLDMHIDAVDISGNFRNR